MAGSSTETFPASSDCTYDVGNVKVEKDLDMQEEEQLNVKTEEEEFIDIKHENGMYSEEEKEEDIDTKENKDLDVKVEVRCDSTV
jgi:hypothetical protein